MTHFSDSDITELVKDDRVHRSIYTDPAIFDLEMERLWGRAWIYVGHESQVKNPGDYFTTNIALQPVILTRHKDNKLHVLFNRCAHKGAQVVGDVCGHAQQLRCCYHGYVFDTDGTLLHIPKEEAYQGTGFGKGKPNANMQQVPRVDSYRGLIFANLAETGVDLKTWLGSTASSIDDLIERSPEGEIEIAGGCFRYLHDSNWKMFVENIADAMHPMVVHQSSSATAKTVYNSLYTDEQPLPFELELVSPFTNNYEFFEKMGATACHFGHAYTGGQTSIHSSYSPVSGYSEALVKAYGEARTAEILSVNRHSTLLYPSLLVKGAVQIVRVVRPVAVNKTIVESWVFKLKGAPDELFQRSITYANTIFSQANLVGPDDYEAYHRIQAGLHAQGNDWVSMHRNFGQDECQEDGNRKAIGTSDMVFRNQYQAWKNYMTNNKSI